MTCLEGWRGDAYFLLREHGSTAYLCKALYEQTIGLWTDESKGEVFGLHHVWRQPNTAYNKHLTVIFWLNSVCFS